MVVKVQSRQMNEGMHVYDCNFLGFRILYNLSVWMQIVILYHSCQFLVICLTNVISITFQPETPFHQQSH